MRVSSFGRSGLDFCVSRPVSARRSLWLACAAVARGAVFVPFGSDGSFSAEMPARGEWVGPAPVIGRLLWQFPGPWHVVDPVRAALFADFVEWSGGARPSECDEAAHAAYVEHGMSTDLDLSDSEALDLLASDAD